MCETSYVCVGGIGRVLLCLCAICMTQAQGGSLLVGRLGREVSVSGKGGTRAAQFNPSFLPLPLPPSFLPLLLLLCIAATFPTHPAARSVAG